MSKRTDDPWEHFAAASDDAAAGGTATFSGTGTLVTGQGDDLRSRDGVEIEITVRGTASQAPAAPPVAAAPHLGIHLHPWNAYYDRPGTKSETPNAMLLAHLDAIARIKQLAPFTLSRVRVDGGWSTSQPTNKAPTLDHWYNRRLMQLCELAAARDVELFPVVHQSPPWARSPAWDEDSQKVRNDLPKRLPDKPESITVWAEWFARTFRDHFREIQFWNEPNLRAFSGSIPGSKATAATPERYMPVLTAFAAAARAGNPAVRIGGPSTSQLDVEFIAKCYALGLREATDLLMVHPYQGRQSVSAKSRDVAGVDKSAAGWERARISYGLPKLVEIMRANGDGGKAIWCTEQGWSASPTGVGTAGVGDLSKGNTWATLDDKAASYLRGWLDLLVTQADDSGPQPAYGQVAMTVLYELYDPSSTDPHQLGFNAITKAGELKPQAAALGVFRAANPVLRPLYGADS